jgi:hypothetical protein
MLHSSLDTSSSSEVQKRSRATEALQKRNPFGARLGARAFVNNENGLFKALSRHRYRDSKLVGRLLQAPTVARPTKKLGPHWALGLTSSRVAAKRNPRISRGFVE